MKDEVLKRDMFSMPLSKSARNSGIMEGFEDDEIEDLENQNYEDMPPMARNPQNPEILMNTLRGDMRSVDARYMELAQMVGEEAAYETPPEVLAMLQPQLAQQQQGGIGSLPQAANMMPPAMGGGAPMGGPGGAPAMPMQGMPPEGGIAPFSQGGAEQAPPTPDGLPPMRAAVGAFVTPLTRAAQYLGDKASSLGSMGTAANVAAGRFLSQGFPQTFRPVFENVRGPGGRFTAEQIISYPTLTQHLATLAGPRATELAGRFLPGASAVVGGIGGLGVAGLMRDGAPQADLERAQLLKAYEQMYYQDKDRSIPMPFLSDRTNEQLIQDLQGMGRVQASSAAATMGGPRPGAAAPTAPAGEPAAPKDDLGDFIQRVMERDKAKEEARLPDAFGEAVARPKPLSKAERIKAGYEQNIPLYQEILGDDKETAKINALLLLADAGLKFAGSRQRTVGMALSEAAAGIPRGFAALLAQAKENEGKIKGLALSAAINDVAAQDKAVADYRTMILEHDLNVMRDRAKEDAKRGSNTIIKDGGLGLRIRQTKDGSFIDKGIDPKDPSIQDIINSPYTLRPTDNPFVEYIGPARTTGEYDEKERVKLGVAIRSLDDALKELDQLQGMYAKAYSPGTWFQDISNNLFVPVLSGVGVKPDLDQVAAVQQIKTGLTRMLKRIAAANDTGRVAVAELEMTRPIFAAMENPTAFFANKEIAAKAFATLRADLQNSRHQVATQTGAVGDEMIMRVPSTGTQNDPFVIPSDPGAQKSMFNYLASTIGKLQNPAAQVYIRTPDGRVTPFNPRDLRALQGAE